MRVVSIISLLLVTLAGATLAETTIEWWQFWTDPNIRPAISSMVEEFEAANPDIKVNLTDLTWSNGHEKIVLAYASGSQPDVVELGSDWIAQFAVAGRLADLTDRVADQKLDYQGWSMATYNDRVYAKPWILGTRVLFYNKELLARTDLEEDYVPVNWDMMKEAAEKISALGNDTYGWGSNTAEKHRLYKKIMPFLWSARARVLSEDGQYCVISSQQAVEALKFYKGLHDCCGYVANQRGIEDAFLDGKVGMILSGDWLLKRIEAENRTIDFGTMVMPGPEAAFGRGRAFIAGLKTAAYPGKSFLGGEFLAISAASEKQEAALKLVDFITSPENQIRFCKANRSANPSSRTAQQDGYFQDHKHLKTFVMQMNLTSHPPVDPNWVFIEAELEKAVEQVLFENALPGETLRALQHKITEIRE